MIRFAQTTAASGGFFSNRNNLWILIGFGILLFLVLVLVIAALISHQKKKKAIGTPAEELWHDRKRVLGLPLTMTRYWIDHDRFYVKTGFFNREVDEVLLYRILDIKSSRNFGQILCGVGTILLYSADQSNRTIKVENIRKPTKVHRYLSEIVERERVEHGIAGRELYGSASIDMDHVDGSCDTGEHDLSHGHVHEAGSHGSPDGMHGKPDSMSGATPPVPPGPPSAPLHFDDMK